MKRNISELKNQFKGNNVYVIGSGKSIDFYPDGFFEDKLTLGINKVWKYFNVDYSVFTHKNILFEAVEAKQKCLVSDFDIGENSKTPNHAENYLNAGCWIYPVNEYSFSSNLMKAEDGETIVTGQTTAIPTIHLAAYMGAKNIFLCGIDGVYINGEYNFTRYIKDQRNYFLNQLDVERQEQWKNEYNRFAKTSMIEMIALRTKLKQIYGCNIMSLSPFVSMRADGNLVELESSEEKIRSMRDLVHSDN